MTDAKTDIAARFKKIVVEHLDVAPDRVTPEASFDDLGADIVDFIELTMAAEEEFGVNLDDADIDALVTVGDAIKLIEREVG